MSPRRVLLAVLAVLAAVLPAHASAIGSHRVLTITGTGHTFGVFTVAEETYYRLEGTPTAEYRGGRWAGFAIDADFPHVWSVYTRHPILHGSAANETKINGEGWGVLRPGRHRVYLFADGQPVTIRVRWTGPNTTLALETTLDAHVEADQAKVAAGGARLSLPQEGTAGTVTAAVTHWQRLQPSSAYVIRSCHARPPASWQTCDRRFYRTTFTDTGANVGGINSFAMDGTPRQGVTKGRVYYSELTGVATGLLTLMTVRYRPVAEDYRRLPI